MCSHSWAGLLAAILIEMVTIITTNCFWHSIIWYEVSQPSLKTPLKLLHKDDSFSIVKIATSFHYKPCFCLPIALAWKIGLAWLLPYLAKGWMLLPSLKKVHCTGFNLQAILNCPNLKCTFACFFICLFFGLPLPPIWLVTLLSNFLQSARLRGFQCLAERFCCGRVHEYQPWMWVVLGCEV